MSSLPPSSPLPSPSRRLPSATVASVAPSPPDSSRLHENALGVASAFHTSSPPLLLGALDSAPFLSTNQRLSIEVQRSVLSSSNYRVGVFDKRHVDERALGAGAGTNSGTESPNLQQIAQSVSPHSSSHNSSSPPSCLKPLASSLTPTPSTSSTTSSSASFMPSSAALARKHDFFSKRAEATAVEQQAAVANNHIFSEFASANQSQLAAFKKIPYIKYTPKHNTAMGDAPRQAAHDNKKYESLIANSEEMSRVDSASPSPPTCSSTVTASCPPLRTSTTFNLTGSSTTSVTSPLAKVAMPVAVAEQTTESVPAWLQLAVPSLASTTLPAEHALASNSNSNGNNNGSNSAADATFITGVNVEAQALQQQHDDGEDEQKQVTFAESTAIVPFDAGALSNCSTLSSALSLLLSARAPLPQLELPSAIKLADTMQQAMSTIDFCGGAQTSLQQAYFKEMAFKTYFHAHSSKAVIHDAFYWSMLHFFGEPYQENMIENDAGAVIVNAHEHLSEMSRYRLYSTHLKRYLSQEAYYRKKSEYEHELDRRAKMEKDVGSSGIPHAHLPHLRDEMAALIPPVQSAQQKRQPLVLLGDLPHFDVNQHLNVGPVPREVFERRIEQQIDEFQHDNNNTHVKQVLASLKSRIATNFVKLFLTVPAHHKDFFYLHYFDALAQVLYYSFAQAYPATISLISHRFFQVRLLQLTAYWTMGYVPTNLHVSHWKEIHEENSNEEEETREEKNDTPMIHAATSLEKKLNALSVSIKGKKHSLFASGHASASSGYSNPKDTNTSVITNNGADKNKKGNATNLAFKDNVNTSKLVTANINNSNTNNNTSSQPELTGDLLIDVGQKQCRTSARIPLKVIRKKVKLHHSELIQTFINSRHFEHQSNHALKIPISIPAIGDQEKSGFLDELHSFNDKCRNDTMQHRNNYQATKSQFARLAMKQRKEVQEIHRKFDQERERALREAPAFAKTLVSEYQERKYNELKAPSKNLALRRLGHFRPNKEDGGMGNDREVSNTLIKSSLHMA